MVRVPLAGVGVFQEGRGGMGGARLADMGFLQEGKGGMGGARLAGMGVLQEGREGMGGTQTAGDMGGIQIKGGMGVQWEGVGGQEGVEEGLVKWRDGQDVSL